MPWIKATDEPIVNGQMESYDGINLLLLTDYCRTDGLGERIFCTYEQRQELDRPVWHNEKGFYIKLATGQGLYVFACPRTQKMPKDAFAAIDARHKELHMKFREYAASTRKYPNNNDGICSMIYHTVVNSMLVKDNFNKLIAEVAATSVAAYLGISKKIEKENIPLLDSWMSVLQNKRIGLASMISRVNGSYRNVIALGENVVLDAEKYKTNISQTLERLKHKDADKKLVRLEDILSPKIRR